MSARIIPHGALTAAQLELLCAREGLALARTGRDRFCLVQMSGRPRSALRIANVYPEIIPDRIDRILRALRRVPPDPEAA